jgi:hypothetical protein
MEQLKLWEDPRDFREHKKYRKGLFKSKAEIEAELHEQGKTRIYKVLSFGGGTQSAHLIEEHFRGNLEYDFIIFSDTGAEPEFIHEQVKWWQRRQKEYSNKTPFIITSHSSMIGGLEEMLMRYIHTEYQRFQMPVYFNRIDENTGEEVPAGLMPRQCTVDFKIIPVKQAARKAVMVQMGLKPTQRIPKDVAFIIDIGFSYDEINRVSLYQSPQYKYMYLSYPLVEEGISTEESIQYLEENQFPSKRSRCYLCPFNCDDKDIGMDWMEIIKDEPLSFLKACYFDEQLRKVQSQGKKNMLSIPYFHYKRIPLKEAYETEYQKIVPQYEKAFSKWLQEWNEFIQDKYLETA